MSWWQRGVFCGLEKACCVTHVLWYVPGMGDWGFRCTLATWAFRLAEQWESA
jgi:hypothetical protein